MRRTVSWSTSAVAAAVLALATPVCAHAWAEGDDDVTWDSTTSGDSPSDTWGSDSSSSSSSSSSSGSLELAPADARPGTTVTANTTGCGKDRRATGDANSLGAGDFPLQTSTHQGDVVGQFQVPSGARPGTYPVSVSCESGTVVRQTLTVTGGGGSDLHGVHAGDGGSLGRLSTAQLVLGGMLIAGSLGAAGYYVRRRAQEW
ncbi:hypothetical protein G3I40_33965 [Streptomyces sp. SID14478]|uniref:hypothetical protein n=1 Tax=Streptomyces sp. SID14478 TaxID=2706073 RepID=UPI0013DFD1ED|nr:hypothetical protein [Streptomyces sp. SID14478]NEB80177.1 hypothetical protein [Streptomyces sp. SID14478]